MENNGEEVVFAWLGIFEGGEDGTDELMEVSVLFFTGCWAVGDFMAVGTLLRTWFGTFFAGFYFDSFWKFGSEVCGGGGGGGGGVLGMVLRRGLSEVELSELWFLCWKGKLGVYIRNIFLINCCRWVNGLIVQHSQ